MPSLIEDWARHGQGHTDLLIALDNCSDQSLRILTEIQASGDFPAFSFFATGGNANGKSGALLQAFARYPELLLSRRFVLLWDADREYDLSALPFLIDAIPESPEEQHNFLVSGMRSGPLLPSSRIANRLIRSILAFRTGRIPPHDILTGARLLPAAELHAILRQASHFDIETRIVRHYLDSGGSIFELPVHYRPRKIGKKIRAVHIFSLIRAAAS